MAQARQAQATGPVWESLQQHWHAALTGDASAQAWPRRLASVRTRRRPQAGAPDAPLNSHAEGLAQALASGKHVLCEKSITLNAAELDEAVELAREHQVVLAEAQTIYHMPIYQKLSGLAAAGAFGPLRTIQLNFGSYKPYDMTNRFFN